MPRNSLPPLLILGCIAAFAGFSCSDTPPRARAIPEDRCVDLYAHVLVLREEGRLSRADSLTVHGRTDSLCGAFGLTGVQLDTELGYYRSDLAVYREFYERVIQRLEQLQREERAPGR